jgi:hypothetical protein
MVFPTPLKGSRSLAFIRLILLVTDDPPPYKDGVRINSPHYLCKMVQDAGQQTYTLVVSQYEKSNTIHYTLRVYSSVEFSLKQIMEPYNPKYEQKVTTEHSIFIHHLGQDADCL